MTTSTPLPQPGALEGTYVAQQLTGAARQCLLNLGQISSIDGYKTWQNVVFDGSNPAIPANPDLENFAALLNSIQTTLETNGPLIARVAKLGGQ